MSRADLTTLAIYALLAVLLPLAVACSGPSSPVSEAPEDYATQEVPVRWSVANAESLSTLVRSSDAVFIGTVTQQTGQRTEPLGPTALLDPLAPDQPASVGPPGFPVSVFEVRVNEPLAGGLSVDQIVILEQLGGIVPTNDGQDVRLALEGDTPLATGRQYLLFATVKPNGTYSSAAFAKILIDEGDLTPDVAWAHLPAIAAIAGLRADSAAQDIRDAQ